MRVKICGIMSDAAAQTAVQHGADALGFVFAKSKREISIESAKQIIEKLPKDLLKAGVFVNPSKEWIEEVVSTAGINIVQLHGEETPEFCASISYPVIKAFSIESASDLEKIHEYPCEYVLLDGPKGKKYHGGNGISFDWNLLSDFDFKDKKVILAGGLTEANVSEAITEAAPFMVDVSSGVETEGQKDLAKIKAFLSCVKGARL
ncbi:phosphoribosylanthranilate isomerase [Bacillus benzoevorans]|uniref:N-(5'-phosphoribosyl)anthranilate isomerase n=1 Tax=Bacillus benzoevorans TaxID=1456 RepID=A0A7X0HUW5_9BACI|nr:phosphoribosylanthranilate isomerase [Bacillus benzoevorans]MBB6446357.1 phosphoribosylanthranilate isomerase [Bacillus benzoevorans]